MSIGSGIFSVPAIILGEVGSVGMTILSFMMGSLIALFGALAYCEWGCMRYEH
jgi:amino acid transporter